MSYNLPVTSRHRYRLAPLALAALLGACASTLPPTPADRAQIAPTLPAGWSRAPAGAVPDGDWWAGFGDPLLLALVDEALATNLDLASARANVERARAQRDLADAGRLPQLGSSASGGRVRSGENYSRQLSAGLDASWEPDFFGANASTATAAAADLAAAGATLQATRLAVAAETAIAYLQWRGTREQYAIARESAASQAQTLQLVQWRVQAGLASAVDAEQARASLEQTRAQLPALQTTLQQTENALAILLGRAPATLGERLATAPEAAPSLQALPAGVPADLLRRRPDLLAAEWTLASALATLDARRADRLPDLSLSGSLALRAATWSGLGGAGAVAASVLAGISWPVFDGGAARARVEAQQATLDAARASYRAAVLAALGDVEDNLVALDRGGERVAALERAAEAAANAAELARARYRSGLIDFGTLLDAERSLLSARSSLAGARTDLALAGVRLYKGLGGGWTAEATRP